jgi:photosystem II stability/assembly factor-like uncharacterized protein
MKLKITLFGLLFLIGNMAFSQPFEGFVDSYKKKQGKVSFFDIQQAYYEHLKNNDAEKGYRMQDGEKHRYPGWKQFKRWEHFWEIRVDRETGAFPERTPFQVYKEYKKHQNAHKKSSDNSSWINLGTDFTTGGYHGIGRLNCIGFHPDKDSTFWVGSPSGGLWKTTDHGGSWVSQTDNNPVLGVSDIAIPSNYSSTKTLYIATGDRDAGDNYSTGILKSTDGGESWSVSYSFEVGNRELVNHLLVHPNDDNTLVAATTEGVLKTTNAGATWDTLSTVALKDVEFKPGDPSVLYGSTYNYSNPTKIYRSVDGGQTWSESLSKNGIRTEISVSADAPDIVYAVVANSDNGLEGIYKSTDSGKNFSLVYDEKNMLGWAADGSDSGGQGFYDLTIEADPNHADTVFVGGINTWRSTDGGSNWTIVSHWSGSDGITTVHADKHAMDFQNGTSVLFEGNDGGIYRSDDVGQTWEDLTNGMVISQIYKLSTAQSDTDIVINGLQDNGTKLYHKGDWYDVMGGDGMKCMIDYKYSDVQYTTLPNGKIRRTQDGWTSASDITPANASSGAWVTPLAMHPDDPSIIYAGYADLYKSTDRGDNWTKISDVLSASEKLRSITIAESNPDNIYIADLSNIWKTVDGGSNWSNITDGLPVTSSSITNIEVKYDDPSVLWVSMGDYDTNNVFKSTDGGKTWNNISEGLPSLPVLDVIEDDSYKRKDVLYAGTDVGAYRKVGNEEWKPFSNNLPNVIVNDLDIYYDQENGHNVLRAATYGRGLWETPIHNQDWVSNPTILQTTGYADSVVIEWEPNTDNDTILLARTEDRSFSDPSQEVDYNNTDTLPEGEDVLYYGINNVFVHDSLAANTRYDYKIWSYDGFAYSTGEAFYVKSGCDTPSTQISNINIDEKKAQSVTLSWDRGDGDGVFILGNKSDSINQAPVCGASYDASLTFSEGDNLGYGNYAIYNGNANSVTIEDLEGATDYYFALYEYNTSDNCYLFPPELVKVKTATGTGIQPEKQDKLDIYPNPADKRVVFKIPDDITTGRLEIIDMAGNTVLEKSMSDHRTSINIQNWNEGTYIVKIHTDKSIFKEKLIVE